MSPYACDLDGHVEYVISYRGELRFGSFDELHDMRHREAAVPPPPPPQDNGSSRPLMTKTQTYKAWAAEEQGHLSSTHRTIVAMSKFVCELDCANYMLANKQKLMLAMLLDGDHWRAHQRQIFHFENGAWVMKGSLDIVAWDNLLALEGLFIQLALKVQEENVAISWSWDEAKHYILDIVGDNVEANGIAKDNSDHLRASTANKTWQAHWTRRCADMMAQLRKSWEEEKPKHVLSKLFLSEWDTPMPHSKGICFDDVYLNEVWEITPKSPETNCYFKLDYNYYYENVVQSLLILISDLSERSYAHSSSLSTTRTTTFFN